MSEELKSLKSKRGQIKGKLTRFKNYFHNIDKENASDNN